MKDIDKTRDQLIFELDELRHRIDSLKQPDPYYRTLFNNTFDAIFAYHLTEEGGPGNFIEVNDHACRKLGHTREKLLTMSLFDIVNPLKEDSGCTLTKDLLVTRKPIVFESIIVASDKSELQVEVSAHLFDLEMKPTVLAIVRDISKRKQAQAALRVSDEKYRMLVENLRVGIGVVDSEENVVFVNPSFAEICGYSMVQLFEMNLTQIVTANERAKINEESEKRRNGLSSDYETIITRSDGEERVIKVHATPIFGEDGNFEGTLASVEDITGYKRAENELRESERKYRVLFEKNSDAIFIYDPDTTNILDANEATSRMYGYEKDELIGMSCLNFSAEVDQSVSVLERVRDDGQVNIPLRYHQKKDGTIFPVEIRSFAITLDGKNVMFGVSKDITERQQAYREIESLAKFPNENPNAVLRISNEGLVLYSNEASQSLLRSWDYKEGQPIATAWHEIVQKVLKDKECIQSEVECGEKILSLSFTPVASENYVNIYALDITEQKKAQEAFRKSEEQLRQAQKMETVGRLAGGVAHDFNNLLTTIMGYSDFLIMGQNPDDTTKEGLHEIRKAAERAASLTHQLLAFSRKQILRPQVINLNALIANLSKMLKRLIGENIDLFTELDSNEVYIKADPGQIEQVIMNLAVNAKDAMPDGGKLTIEARHMYLDDSYHRQNPEVIPGDYVLLGVSDTGIGIDEKIRKDIFEPFFTTKERGKGTGLGLSTVYGIVKQSGGYIWVYSEPGDGTSFKVYLPQVRGIGEQQEHPSTELSQVSGTETILLVEDESSLRNLVSQILRRHGYSICEAENGTTALEIASGDGNKKIDLLITDVIMPGMNGKELSEILQKRFPDIKVLFVSGYTDNAIVHHGVLKEGVWFLQKPFSQRSLAEKVREILDKK